MAPLKQLKGAVSALVKRGEEIFTKTGQILHTGTVDKHALADEVCRAYHEWYSQAVVLVGANLPERESEFITLHAGTERGEGAGYYASNLFVELYEGGGVYINARHFRTCLQTEVAILKSILPTIEVRALRVRELVAGDLMTDEIGAAGYLLEHGFVRPAGIVAGLVLEQKLKLMCEKAGIQVGDRETIGSLNARLRDYYDDPTDYKRVSWMAEVRAHCGHDKGKDPATEQVRELIDSVHKFVSTVS